LGAVKVTIRPYDQRDAGDLAEVNFRSVRQAALSDYTIDQVRAWLPERPSPVLMHQRASDGRMVLVAVDDHDRVVAYIDLEASGHIDHLFCAPVAVGHGIASQLYDVTEATARKQGIDRLFVEASEPARRLFERKGFVVRERQDLIRNGVAIHNYKMAKLLVRGDEGRVEFGPSYR
jgi:putative acetyltransferase